MKVIIINGPNLNLLGKRETSIYGDISFDEYFKKLSAQFLDIEIEYFQSNIEGELINKIQEVGFTYDHIILNAGGYTHTSVSIADCIRAIETPVTEVHITNIHSREDFRKKSLLSQYCRAVVCGLGLDSYKAVLLTLN